jgi:hypothetical protein
MPRVSLTLDHDNPDWLVTWRVAMDDAVHRETKVRRKAMPGILVSINEATGAIELYPSFHPGSDAHELQETLFHAVHADVVAALVGRMRAGELTDEGYDEFRNLHGVKAT